MAPRGLVCKSWPLTYTALRQVFSTNEEGVKKKAFKKDKRKVSAIVLDMITHRFIEKWMWKDEFMAKKKAWRKKCRQAAKKRRDADRKFAKQRKDAARKAAKKARNAAR